jgi:hypothetical protein
MLEHDVGVVAVKGDPGVGHLAVRSHPQDAELAFAVRKVDVLQLSNVSGDSRVKKLK